jgi:hypothetical protein
MRFRAKISRLPGGSNGQRSSSLVYGTLSLRGCIKHIESRSSTVGTRRHRHDSRARNRFRHSEVVAKVFESDCPARLLLRHRCWEWEQTVQFEGLAIAPEGDELRRYQEAYFAVWPDGPARMSWPAITWFVVRPRWIRFSDFDQNPPRIEEKIFPQI